ncbi:MAG: hypothetical protein Q9227_000978 [Pyrenula ochraceoflavens]
MTRRSFDSSHSPCSTPRGQSPEATAQTPETPASTYLSPPGSHYSGSRLYRLQDRDNSQALEPTEKLRLRDLATPEPESLGEHRTGSSSEADNQSQAHDDNSGLANDLQDLTVTPSLLEDQENELADAVERVELSSASETSGIDGDQISPSEQPLPYSANDEILPEEPYYDPSFQSCLRDARKLAHRVSQCLDKCVEAYRPDSILYKRREEAKSLSQFECSSTRLIGVVGNSGVGKSSLINSLLDVKGLAMTGAAGTAVTTYVTEYWYKGRDQQSAYCLEAECLTTEEIIVELQELLEDLQRPKLIERTDVSALELEEAEKRHARAKDTLQAAFGNRSRYPDFEVRALESQDHQTFHETLNQLIGWAAQLPWPQGTHDGRWNSSADSVGDVHGIIRPFFEKGLWVFVKTIRIFLGAKVLKTGLILADLPGEVKSKYQSIG